MKVTTGDWEIDTDIHKVLYVARKNGHDESEAKRRAVRLLSEYYPEDTSSVLGQAVQKFLEYQKYLRSITEPTRLVEEDWYAWGECPDDARIHRIEVTDTKGAVCLGYIEALAASGSKEISLRIYDPDISQITSAARDGRWKAVLQTAQRRSFVLSAGKAGDTGGVKTLAAQEDYWFLKRTRVFLRNFDEPLTQRNITRRDIDALERLSKAHSGYKVSDIGPEGPSIIRAGLAVENVKEPDRYLISEAGREAMGKGIR